MGKKAKKSAKAAPPKYWVNRYPNKVNGILEISKSRQGILIGGDPNGLCSLAKLLIWLADVDQEAVASMPDGDREHIHLHPTPPAQLTRFSSETELCRLDAKGTGELPDYYRKKNRKARKS